MAKRRITSKPGLFGMTYHYENGKYVGKSRPGLLGDRKIHYNAEGRQIGTSRPGVLSDEVHYDAENKRYISSYQGLAGTIHTSNGRPVGKTVHSVFGTSYSSVEDTELNEITEDEHLTNYEDETADVDTADFGIKSQSTVKKAIWKVIGSIFAIESVFFLVMTIVFALKGKNIAPGTAACIISAGISFFCFRSVWRNFDKVPRR